MIQNKKQANWVYGKSFFYNGAERSLVANSCKLMRSDAMLAHSTSSFPSPWLSVGVHWCWNCSFEGVVRDVQDWMSDCNKEPGADEAGFQQTHGWQTVGPFVFHFVIFIIAVLYIASHKKETMSTKSCQQFSQISTDFQNFFVAGKNTKFLTEPTWSVCCSALGSWKYMESYDIWQKLKHFFSYGQMRIDNMTALSIICPHTLADHSIL